MQLLNIGFGNVVSAARIISIINPEAAPIKRMIQEAKDEKTAVDATCGDRRKIIVKGFNDLGLTCRDPKGAFYAFPCIKSTGLNSEEFCERLLYSKRVALVPGNAFGESGEGYVRASYCYSLSHIKEALERIGEFLEELKTE